MTELRINKDTVTHIKIYDVRKGLQNLYDSGMTDYKLLPYKKERTNYFVSLLNETIIYPEGYYRNGIYELRDYSTTYFTKEEVENSEISYDMNGYLYTRPLVKIYVGKYLIKDFYFDTFNGAQGFCRENFPNVNVILNN